MPRRRRRKRFRRKGGRSLAGKAYRLARKAYNSTDHELKYSLVNFTNLAIAAPNDAAAITVFPMNVIPQGVDDRNRIGDKIVMKSFACRLAFTLAANVTPGPSQYVRCMLVYDRQPNGGLASAANILEDVSSTDANVRLASPHNIEYRLRFRVLWDSLVYVTNQNVATRVFIRRKFLKHTVQYNGGGADISNIHTGSLLLVLVGEADSTADVTLRMSVDGQCILRYVG